jgi:hypothetical protein
MNYKMLYNYVLLLCRHLAVFTAVWQCFFLLLLYRKWNDKSEFKLEWIDKNNKPRTENELPKAESSRTRTQFTTLLFIHAVPRTLHVSNDEATTSSFVCYYFLITCSYLGLWRLYFLLLFEKLKAQIKI